jgi:predicted nucleic acid-binding protein
VIDVNCFVSIFINKETTWLLNYVSQNKLQIFIDRNLVDELIRVLKYSRIKKLLPLDIQAYIGFVKLISTHV